MKFQLKYFSDVLSDVFSIKVLQLAKTFRFIVRKDRFAFAAKTTKQNDNYFKHHHFYIVYILEGRKTEK